MTRRAGALASITRLALAAALAGIACVALGGCGDRESASRADASTLRTPPTWRPTDLYSPFYYTPRMDASSVVPADSGGPERHPIALDATYTPSPATDVDAAVARAETVLRAWTSELPHGLIDPRQFDASLCHWVCHWAEHCDDLASFGGRQACAERCRAMLADGAAVNLACYASSCSARARCITGENLPVLPACREVCRYARACPQYMALGLPPDEATCATVCSGQAAAFPSFADALPCLARNAPSCDLDQMLGCLATGEIYCPTLCEETGGCMAYFPSREACYQTCRRYTPAQAWQALRCFNLYECTGDASCLTAPIPPSCRQWAELTLRACREYTWPPSAQLLAVECALPVAVDGLDPVADPGQCLGALSREDYVCRPPQSAAPFQCTVQPPLACQRICELVRRCPVSEYRAACEERCVERFWRKNRARIGEVLQCVQEAACDPTVMRQCWSLQHNQPFCDRYCNLASRCDPSTPFDACAAACAAGLSSGDVRRIATLTCAADAQCETFSRCRDAAPPPADPACRAACNSVRGNCHHVIVSFDTGEAACNTACAVILQRDGRVGDTAYAQCVVDDFDHECRPQNLTHCH